MTGRSFKLGEIVGFLNSTGKAVVCDVSGESIKIRDEDGFEYWIQASEIVYLDPALEKAYDKVSVKVKDIVAGATKEFADEKEGVPEIDLHIHELVEDERGMQPAEILRLQLEVFRQTVDKARRDKLKQIIVIHGVGKDVLREEIWKILRQEEGCRFEPADFRVYGKGATEIWLW